MATTILITRPRSSSEGFARLIRTNLGEHTPIVVSPVIEIKSVSVEMDLDNVRTLIFTSHHAINSFCKQTPRRDFYCYTVGSLTFETAQKAGFKPSLGNGTAASLVHKITEEKPDGQALHVRGEHIAFDMMTPLRDAGIHLSEVILYHQAYCPLTTKAKAVLASSTNIVLPVFSTRSAKLFFEKETWKGKLFVAAFSEAIASVISKEEIYALKIASKPAVAEMLNAVEYLWYEANQLEGNGPAQ